MPNVRFPRLKFFGRKGIYPLIPKKLREEIGRNAFPGLTCLGPGHLSETVNSFVAIIVNYSELHALQAKLDFVPTKRAGHNLVYISLGCDYVWSSFSLL